MRTGIHDSVVEVVDDKEIDSLRSRINELVAETMGPAPSPAAYQAVLISLADALSNTLARAPEEIWQVLVQLHTDSLLYQVQSHRMLQPTLIGTAPNRQGEDSTFAVIDGRIIECGQSVIPIGTSDAAPPVDGHFVVERRAPAELPTAFIDRSKYH